MDLVKRKHRRFTPDALIAAVEARRRKAESVAAHGGTPAVFAVRLPDGQFGWEIRRFGAIVLDRSKTTYETMILARSAGEAALAKM